MSSSKKKTVECPVCSREVPLSFINFHLDSNCSSTNQTSSSPTHPLSSSQSLPTIKSSSSSSSKRKQPSDEAEDELIIEDQNQKQPEETPSKSKFSSKGVLHNVKPLADKLRPQTLEDVVGQSHLLDEGMLLRTMIENDQLGSMLFWGPPGTGKTTLARVIANSTKSSWKELSATNTKLENVRKIFDEATNMLKLTGKRTILFIDEVQRFSRSQQDVFLPYLEAGLIICIFATTENPSFRVQPALLSRCRVFTLTKLNVDECTTILDRAVKVYNDDNPSKSPSNVDTSLLKYMASVCDGDARVALQALELAMTAGKTLDKEQLKLSLRKAHLQYDRTGENHYDTISALHKSIRGSDANASLYWLARMLEAGEDPLYVARRMVRMASEDVGLADPHCVQVALAAYQAAERIGMPECDVILAQCAVYLAEAPKSIRVYEAYKEAKSLVSQVPAYPVPLHIRNAPTGLMKDLGYGSNYRYEPSYAHPVLQDFMPPELKGTKFLRESEDDITDKVIDWNALSQWELHHGKEWPGRDKLLNEYKNR